MAAVIVQLELRICQVGRGTTAVLVQQLQSNNPGFGQSQLPGPMPSEQFLFKQDAQTVPGTDGSVTLANLNTALTNAVTAFAGATGTPIISAADLAQINGWATGSP